MDQRQTMLQRPFYDQQPRNNLSLASAVNPNYQHPPQIPQAQPPPPQAQQQQQQRVALQSASSRQVFSPQDAAEAQTRMEESRQRSITLVFWYKAGCEPIRLHEEIATFPLFSLAQAAQLVKDLGLLPNTYIDAYNPQAGTWEQQTITTVRQVHSEQRLLFRMRKSLLEGLKDQECLSLENEIRMQPLGLQNGQVLSSPQRSLKRPMPDTATTDASPPAAKQFRAAGPGPFVVKQQTNNVATPQAYQSPGTSHSPMPNPHLHQSLSPDQQQSIGNAMAIDSSPPLPAGAKRWPNDYHVCEISAGLDRVDDLVSQTPSVTQKAAFERVFGCRYVKSTVCRHRSVWKRADNNLREQFKRMGTVERALWGEFVKKTGFQREGQKNGKSQSQVEADENDHGRMQPQTMDYGMNGMNSLGLDMVGHHHAHALMGVNGSIGDALNAEPPMASLRPPR
ncbi:hypothetical protein BDY19DRAFT_926960 [Irpex rosettiformis]|uniref:Uncharacterized protein n=1 Tax=Irpex rosettiformis TaxID=378272 RepID=A0ACB8UGV2_9APHY|nr:hypothetical protein BDY19DRAFT_926960 [Irpex rosettiformis]